MKNKIEEIVECFNMTKHPEGGYYSETYRSSIRTKGDSHSLCTSIYFLLPSEDVSKFHRIQSDELWFFHSGSPLIVHTLDENGHTETIVGNDIQAGQAPQFLVPRNTIFGSSVLEKNSYSLVSCVCAPGFEFSEFELFSEEDLIVDFPNFEQIISRLT